MAGYWPPDKVVTWGLNINGLTAQDVDQLTDPIAAGIEIWARVCGVRIERFRNQTAEPTVAVRLLGDLAFDPLADIGAYRAWSEGYMLGLTDEPYPPGLHEQVTLRLNLGASWTPRKLALVAMHEFGHALGCDHAPAGVRSCMSELLDESVTEPQPWEVSWARYYYGPPPGETNVEARAADGGDDRDAAQRCT